MDKYCITERRLKYLLSPNVLTFKNGRITYKNRDITFSNGTNKKFNMNPEYPENPNEIIDVEIRAHQINNSLQIRLPLISTNIAVFTYKGIEYLQVFKMETIDPLIMTNNLDGTLTLSGGKMLFELKSWTYDFSEGGKIKDIKSTYFNMFPPGKINNYIDGTQVKDMLYENEDEYDNVSSYFNKIPPAYDHIPSYIQYVTDTDWYCYLPIVNVYFGEKPPYHTLFAFKHNGESFINFTL